MTETSVSGTPHVKTRWQLSTRPMCVCVCVSVQSSPCTCPLGPSKGQTSPPGLRREEPTLRRHKSTPSHQRQIALDVPTSADLGLTSCDLRELNHKQFCLLALSLSLMLSSCAAVFHHDAAGILMVIMMRLLPFLPINMPTTVCLLLPFFTRHFIVSLIHTLLIHVF